MPKRAHVNVCFVLFCVLLFFANKSALVRSLSSTFHVFKDSFVCICEIVVTRNLPDIHVTFHNALFLAF